LGDRNSTWDTNGPNLGHGTLFIDGSVPGIIELQESGDVFAFDSFFAALGVECDVMIRKE
jgi:hypothetical protein